MTLGKVKRAKLGRTLAVLGDGLEDASRSLTLRADNTAHCWMIDDEWWKVSGGNEPHDDRMGQRYMNGWIDTRPLSVHHALPALCCWLKVKVWETRPLCALVVRALECRAVIGWSRRPRPVLSDPRVGKHVAGDDGDDGVVSTCRSEVLKFKCAFRRRLSTTTDDCRYPHRPHC